MRVLTEDVVVSLTRTALIELQCLHLEDHDVEKLTTCFERCSQLVSISLRGNRLGGTLISLKHCSQLWFLDLSSNSLASIEGLQHFSALGYLDLSYNNLSVKELKKIEQVDIVHLSLHGNHNLEQSFAPSYRTRVLAHVGSPWVLDGHFVHAEERSKADNEKRADGADGDEELTVSSSSYKWDGGETLEAVSTIGQLATRHLQLVQDQPTRVGHLKDCFRLRHLAVFLDEDSKLFNAMVKRMVANGPKPRRKPCLHLDVIRKQLTHGQLGAGGRNPLQRHGQDNGYGNGEGGFDARGVRLDLLVLLAASLLWPSVPKPVLFEALAVLLAPHVTPSSVLKDLAELPAFAASALCFALRSDLMAEVASVPEGPNALRPHLIDLLKAVPEVVAAPLQTAAASPTSSAPTAAATTTAVPTAAEKTHPAGESSSRGNVEAVARRAAILFSRAPSCPALTTALHPTAGAQKVYAALTPLLICAGFDHDGLLRSDEFDDDDDAPERVKAERASAGRHKSLHGFDAEESGRGSSGSNSSGSSSLGLQHKLHDDEPLPGGHNSLAGLAVVGGGTPRASATPQSARQQRTRPTPSVIGNATKVTSGNGESTPSTSCYQAVSLGATGQLNLLNARRPKMGERVRLNPLDSETMNQAQAPVDREPGGCLNRRRSASSSDSDKEGRCFAVVADVSPDGGRFMCFQRPPSAPAPTLPASAARNTGGGVSPPPPAVLVHRSAVFWDPRGWWTHGAAVTPRPSSATNQDGSTGGLQGGGQRLFRQPTAVNQSGVAACLGVPNFSAPPPPGQLSGHGLSSGEWRHLSPTSFQPSNGRAGGSGGGGGGVVEVFSADQAWDSAFVVAPGDVVAAQNGLLNAHNATKGAQQQQQQQQQQHRRHQTQQQQQQQSGASASAGWTRLAASPKVAVGSGRVERAQDVPYALKPRESVSSRLTSANQPTTAQDRGARRVGEEGEGGGGGGLSGQERRLLGRGEEGVGGCGEEGSLASSSLVSSQSTRLLSVAQEWEALQREMGTLLERSQGVPAWRHQPPVFNQALSPSTSSSRVSLSSVWSEIGVGGNNRAMEPPPIDVAALRLELEERRRQRGAKGGGERGEETTPQLRGDEGLTRSHLVVRRQRREEGEGGGERSQRKTSQLRGDEGLASSNRVSEEGGEGEVEGEGGVFNLTSLGTGGPEGSHPHHHRKRSMTLSNEPVVAAARGDERRTLLEVATKPPPPHALSLRQKLDQEMEMEAATALRVQKARVKPWRTMGGSKPTFVVAESEGSSSSSSNQMLVPPHRLSGGGDGEHLLEHPEVNTTQQQQQQQQQKEGALRKDHKASVPVRGRSASLVQVPLHRAALFPAVKSNVLAGGQRRARLQAPAGYVLKPVSHSSMLEGGKRESKTSPAGELATGSEGPSAPSREPKEQEETDKQRAERAERQDEARREREEREVLSRSRLVKAISRRGDVGKHKPTRVQFPLPK